MHVEEREGIILDLIRKTGFASFRQIDAALAALALDARIGAAEGGVGAQQQAVPGCRQPVEFLRVGQLDAVQLGAGAVSLPTCRAWQVFW